MDHLPFHIPDLPFKVDHQQKILLLGSCFSDEIGEKFSFYGFNSQSNPFGTIFHPDPIARFIQESLNESKGERIVQRDDVFLSLDAGSKVYAMSQRDLANKLQTIRADWKEKAKTSTVMFITFGTAWAYHSVSDDLVVGNCHKLPLNLFKKELSSHQSMLLHWKNAVAALHDLNPDLQIVFTVSPVRHNKEGLIENNRSKANLLLLVAELSELKNCHYFPSFELVIDVLRDHRFYKEDLVHPNELAINYVWERLSNTIMSDQTKNLCDRILKMRLAAVHRFLHPESAAAQDHKDRTEQLIRCFLAEHPEIVW
jgi:hypothetical protein